MCTPRSCRLIILVAQPRKVRMWCCKTQTVNTTLTRRWHPRREEMRKTVWKNKWSTTFPNQNKSRKRNHINPHLDLLSTCAATYQIQQKLSEPVDGSFWPVRDSQLDQSCTGVIQVNSCCSGFFKFATDHDGVQAVCFHVEKGCSSTSDGVGNQTQGLKVKERKCR